MPAGYVFLRHYSIPRCAYVKFNTSGDGNLKNVIYALADDHVRTIMECGTEHILE